MKIKAKYAPYPNNCPDKPKPGDTVTVILDPVSDSVIANMYATGFFALGGVAVDMNFEGTFVYDCCNRKATDYDITLAASFSDDFDGLIPFIDDRWTDTGITFKGDWIMRFIGSF